MNDTKHTLEIEVATLWAVEPDAAPGTAGGQEVCSSSLAHDQLLKRGDFAQRRRFRLPPDGILALECSPTLLIARDAEAAFALPDEPRELEYENEDDARLLGPKNRRDERGLIFLRCADGDAQCSFEPGEGPRELVLLPDAYSGRTADCYDGLPRAYAELSSLWPLSRLLGVRPQAAGCLLLDMQTAEPEVPMNVTDAGAWWDGSMEWMDAGAEGDGGADDAGSDGLAMSDAGQGRRVWPRSTAPFVPIDYTLRVCMERARFPFAVGDLLRVTPTSLESATDVLSFMVVTDMYNIPVDPACGPLRMPCGAVLQPLAPAPEQVPGEGVEHGQAHSVLLPHPSCGPSMNRRQTWVEWMQLGGHFE